MLIGQPDPGTLFSFGSPQPFVPLYAVVLGRGGHIFMNIICIIALWLVRPPSFFSPGFETLTKIEHRRSNNSRLPPRLRRSPRRRPPLLILGLPRAQRPTPQRRDSRLGRRRHHLLHITRLQRGFHVAGLRRGGSQRRGVRAHLSIEIAVHAETLSQAGVEFGEME